MLFFVKKKKFATISSAHPVYKAFIIFDISFFLLAFNMEFCENIISECNDLYDIIVTVYKEDINTRDERGDKHNQYKCK